MKGGEGGVIEVFDLDLNNHVSYSRANKNSNTYWITNQQKPRGSSLTVHANFPLGVPKQAFWRFVIDVVIGGWHVSNWNSAFANQTSGSSGLNAWCFGITAIAWTIRCRCPDPCGCRWHSWFVGYLVSHFNRSKLLNLKHPLSVDVEACWAPSIGVCANMVWIKSR